MQLPNVSVESKRVDMINMSNKSFRRVRDQKFMSLWTFPERKKDGYWITLGTCEHAIRRVPHPRTATFPSGKQDVRCERGGTFVDIER